MSTTQIRERMEQLKRQLLKSIGDDEPFENREPLWMEREDLRDQLARMGVSCPSS